MTATNSAEGAGEGDARERAKVAVCESLSVRLCAWLAGELQTLEVNFAVRVLVDLVYHQIDLLGRGIDAEGVHKLPQFLFRDGASSILTTARETTYGQELTKPRPGKSYALTLSTRLKISWNSASSSAGSEP